MFNGATLLLFIIMLAAIWLAYHLEKKQMRTLYCRHCNERLIIYNREWAALAQINRHMNTGNPHACINNLEGHEPR